MSLLTLDEPKAPPPRTPAMALFALGFRPFYLLAASFSALAIGVWMAVYAGALTLALPGVLWHAHEMLFGFAAAVIVGFLFTAGRNWTGLATPRGGALAALAALWLTGRIALAFSGSLSATLIDLAFLPLAAVALARVLLHAQSRRNYFVIVLLGALALCNLGFHLARFGVLAVDPLRALLLALALITVLETAIGGRVIPMFTASALRGVRQWQRAWLDKAALSASALALLLWAVNGGDSPALNRFASSVAALAALLQLARSLGWNPWAARRTPLLWVLHLGHLWIPLALALLAVVQWPGATVPRSAAVHALTLGATGGLIIGMVTRTALGHTGRPLRAGRIETTAYVLVHLAALLRVGSLLFWPAQSVNGMQLAALLWVLAFTLYVARYARWLAQPRPDGRPG